MPILKKSIFTAFLTLTIAIAQAAGLDVSSEVLNDGLERRKRHQAEELIDFMVSDLQATLRQTGRESLLRSLSQQLDREAALHT